MATKGTHPQFKGKSDFRTYLHESGVMDAVLEALGELYKQKDKPSDPIAFIAQAMDHGATASVINPCPEKDEKIGNLKENIENLNTKIKEHEEATAVPPAAEEKPEGDEAAAPAEGIEPAEPAPPEA